MAPAARLDGQVGDLILQPRSHKVVMNQGNNLLGFEDEALPGSVTIDSLPEGSAVLVHSALLHGRRAKPGGEDRPRYFTDVSYCQHSLAGRAVWPSYGIQNRPGIDNWSETGGSLHAAVYEAHGRCGRGRSQLAIDNGIFDLSAFWGASSATPAQLAALEQRKRLSAAFGIKLNFSRGKL